MQIKAAFEHYNINVVDLEKSMAFYEKALGLTEHRRIVPDDGSFIIVFLKDAKTGFRLELTWLRDWGKPEYSMGDNEVHLCASVPNYEEVKQYHKENGWICYENETMRLYFIADPDNHWIEILPEGEA